MATNYKTLSFKMLGGPLDMRAMPDDVADGSVRWRQNFQMLDNRHMCRRDGFRKLFSETPYNNQDLHDQLLSLQTYYNELSPPAVNSGSVLTWPSALCDGVLQTRTQGREPITLLYDTLSTTGRRSLFAGTQSRLYAYNQFTKNWRILADGMGPSDFHWKAATSEDVVVFTNNHDEPVYHSIGQEVHGCAQRAVQEIPDLQSIGVTRAKIVIGWNGLIVFMNVVQNGVVAQNRIIWSDWKKPLSYTPTTGSVAGFQDLANGEIILAAAPLGNFLVVYTNLGIWNLNVAGTGAQPIQFYNYYHSPHGDLCLAFPNGLVSTGTSHLYLGANGINVYAPSLPVPEEVTWIHQATSVMYDDWNKDNCHLPIMEYHFPKNEVYVSWPQLGQTLNSCTLVINIKQTNQSVDVLDHGFTAFVNHRPDTRMTIGDFFLRYGICTEADLAELNVKAGCGNASITPICAATSIWNPTENMALEADPASLCECLGDLSVADLCGTCDSQQAFIAASAQDWCLKEFFYNSSREICTNPTAVGAVSDNGCYASAVGTYQYTGYYSIIRIGPMPIGRTDKLKLLTRVMVEAYPEVAANPAALRLALGVSRNAFDPNLLSNKFAPYNATTNPVGIGCGAIWKRQDDKVFECWEPETADALSAQRLFPDLPFQWEVYEKAYFLYLELALTNNDAGKTAATTGAGCFSRLEFRMKAEDTLV